MFSPLYCSDNEYGVSDQSHFYAGEAEIWGSTLQASGDRLLKKGLRNLSTEEIMRIAAAYFIQLSVPTEGSHSVLIGLTPQETWDVVLVNLLLVAVEKLSNKQYHQASTMLYQCYLSASRSGNPVQRIVFYFSIALQERIDREAILLLTNRPREPSRGVGNVMQQKEVMKLGLHLKLPFSELMNFTSVQTIIENVGSARRIHMVVFSILNGHQWTVLMQILGMRSADSIDYLKITAVGVSEEALAEKGRILVRFAQTLGLPFIFKTLIVEDIGTLKEGMFDVREGEAVGVYSSMFMSYMIIMPDKLRNLMRVLMKLKPCIMTIMDIDANINSAFFINRISASLFYHSTLFDCLDSCMGRNDSRRMIIEGCFTLNGIRSILSSYGSDRMVRHVRVEIWKAFFSRYGLVEVELSDGHHTRPTLQLSSSVQVVHALLLGMGNLSLLSGKVRDNVDADITDLFEEACNFIDNVECLGGKVLVHCFEGKSRSATIILAYLLFRKGLNLLQAWNLLKEVHPRAQPNDGFAKILLDLDKKLYGKTSMEWQQKRPIMKVCPICGKNAGFSSRSLKLHMPKFHKKNLLWGGSMTP